MKNELEKQDWKTNVGSFITPRRKIKLIISVIFVLLILGIILAIFLKGYKSATEKYEAKIVELEEIIRELEEPTATYTIASKEVSIDLIESKIESIGELATVEYLYTDAGKFEDPKQLFGMDIPFTTKSFIAKWDGIIKAGIDVEQISVEVNEKDLEIVICIPKAEILSHEIDNGSIETLDEKDGLFNPVKIEDVREFDAVSKDAMEERAIENGILDKAYENAKEIIEKLVDNEIVKELGYKIVFKENK